MNCVQRNTVLLEQCEVLGEGSPGMFRSFALRRVGAAFSGHHRGDALLQLAATGRGVEQQRNAAAGHHVDETRRDYQLVQCDRSPGRAAVQVADGGDPSVADAHIGAVPGIAHAVDNPAVPQDQIEILGGENL